MSSDSNCSSFASTNPDISGIGVRISFYLQTFLLVLLVDRSWQDAAIALWTFIATSFGLVIAAIVNRAELTLLQALQVSNLVWLANFGTFVALASYSRQKAASSHHSKRKLVARDRDYGVKFGAMLQTILSMVLTLYMWVSAPTFGTESECAHLVIYVLFVIKVPALHSGRIVGLTVTTILTAGYCFITIHEIKSYYANKRRLGKSSNGQSTADIDLERQGERNRKPAVRMGSTAVRPAPSALILSPSRTVAMEVHSPNEALVASDDSEGIAGNNEPLTPMSPVSVSNGLPHLSVHSRRRPRRRKWSFDLDPMLVGVIICQIMVFGYFIVSSELLLVYNQDSNDSNNRTNFGFGQILALIIVLPSFLSVVGAIQENGFKRLSKKKTRKPARKKVPRRPVRSDDEAAHVDTPVSP